MRPWKTALLIATLIVALGYPMGTSDASYDCSMCARHWDSCGCSEGCNTCGGCQGCCVGQKKGKLFELAINQIFNPQSDPLVGAIQIELAAKTCMDSCSCS